MYAAHLVLREEILFRWAEEIAKEAEQESVLLAMYDPVISAWKDQINEIIPEIVIANTCTRVSCPRTCKMCVVVRKTLQDISKGSICINCRTAKLLYIKIKEIRCLPVKHLAIDRNTLKWFVPDEGVSIVEERNRKIHVHPKIYKFIKNIDSMYQNPVLIVQMVKYLEFERKRRLSPVSNPEISTDTDTKEIDSSTNTDINELAVHGLRVSFLCDPPAIESARVNAYRKNNKI